MDTDKVTVSICNYNTASLTNQCIESLRRFNDDAMFDIVVLDNSDQEKYIPAFSNVRVIDNTSQNLVNFNEILRMSPYRLMANNRNNFGSLKHAASIQFLLNVCNTRKMILFDSDVIVNAKLDFIQNEDCVTIADLQEHNTYAYEDDLRKALLYTSKTRFLPYLQLFNVKLMSANNLKYFDFSRMHGVLSPINGNYYDTGASMYEDCMNKKLKFKRIDYHQYITHLGQSSWKRYFK